MIPKSNQGASPLLLEHWKPVPGWEGIYEISNTGRIWGVGRIKCNGRRIQAGIRKSRTARNGYLVISLIAGEKRENALVHCLVARTFIGERPIGLEVNHKDLNRANPRASNLEYITPSANRKYSKISVGERNVNAILTEADVKQILSQRGKRRQSEIASEYNVSRSLICMVMSGKVWGYLTEEMVLR